ncbi:E3 ubiquitin-protein ligase RNF170-like [Bolinopsis microptera]|uniref:E3 ubiquitin-protein ligase RNF170-like n=1 Tax=Bolinopsis microptera TaxID=2820187 RepID=UPI003079B32F
MDTTDQATYVEGVGDEVVFVTMVTALILFTLTIVYYITSSKVDHHGDPSTTQHPQLHPTEGPHSDSCPICLDTTSYPVQTNCGHVFCGACMLACWDHSEWLLSPMPCPMCRQTITLIFLHFNETELTTVNQERPQLLDKIGSYNRRFSGAPRPWMDYIYDIPTLIRRMWSDSGLDFLMRFRIYAYFALALIYVIAPLDLLPESVFGVAGVIDDIIVIVIIALYVTNTYRTYVAYRNLQPLLNAGGMNN